MYFIFTTVFIMSNKIVSYIIFGYVFMGSVVLSICRCSLVLYSAGPGGLCIMFSVTMYIVLLVCYSFTTICLM